MEYAQNIQRPDEWFNEEIKQLSKKVTWIKNLRRKDRTKTKKTEKMSKREKQNANRRKQEIIGSDI